MPELHFELTLRGDYTEPTAGRPTPEQIQALIKSDLDDGLQGLGFEVHELEVEDL